MGDLSERLKEQEFALNAFVSICREAVETSRINTALNRKMMIFSFFYSVKLLNPSFISVTLTVFCYLAMFSFYLQRCHNPHDHKYNKSHHCFLMPELRASLFFCCMQNKRSRYTDVEMHKKAIFPNVYTAVLTKALC